MDINVFDAFIYINLDIRDDRKKSILSELKRIGADSKKIIRIPGYFDILNGSKGCAISHILALDIAILNGYKRALILEDDCIFSRDKKKISKYLLTFFKNFQNDWDVFFLGAKLKNYSDTHIESIRRVTKAHLAHSYAINGKYLPVIRECFVEAYKLMKKDTFYIESIEKVIDRNWIKLQKRDRWYIGKDMITKQYSSFSNIDMRLKSQQKDLNI